MKLYNITKNIEVEVSAYQTEYGIERDGHVHTTEFYIYCVVPFDIWKNFSEGDRVTIREEGEPYGNKELIVTDVDKFTKTEYTITMAYKKAIKVSESKKCNCKHCDCEKETKLPKVKEVGKEQVEGNKFKLSDLPNCEIIIKSDGKKFVLATFSKDGDYKEFGYAKCSEEDKFDFTVGAKLALDRLLSKLSFDGGKSIDAVYVNGIKIGYKGQEVKVKDMVFHVGDSVVLTVDWSTDDSGTHFHIDGVIGLNSDNKPIFVYHDVVIVTPDSKNIQIKGLDRAE